MKTPVFWDSKNLLSTVLLPLAYFYEAATIIRRRLAAPFELPIPIICIGNLTAGGAGKTPVALAIGKRLKDKNIRAFYVSRGYGGSLAGPILVDPAVHSAAQTGDEPLLLVKMLPTVIGKDRVAAIRFALGQGAQLILMDDGFQNPHFIKTLSLIVIDGEYGFGNGRLLPAGPLREMPATGLRRAHAAIILNPTSHTPVLPRQLLCLSAKTRTRVTLDSKKYVAFCGLARPQKFFDSLRRSGASVIKEISFPDHYLYKDADMEMLTAKAALLDAALVTTAKDAARLTPAQRAQVSVAELTLEFDNTVLLDQLLDYMLHHAKP